jgi:hypothetical protein
MPVLFVDGTSLPLSNFFQLSGINMYINLPMFIGNMRENMTDLNFDFSFLLQLRMLARN